MKSVFREPILQITNLYDMQHHPKYQDKITHICRDGEKYQMHF
ncbi:hypothetical protein ACT7DH_14130 [Bacillus pacificus]